MQTAPVLSRKHGRRHPCLQRSSILRMMACIDIYQALTEERPYKKGKTYEAACEILENMASNGWLDSRIVENIRKCFGESEVLEGEQ